MMSSSDGRKSLRTHNWHTQDTEYSACSVEVVGHTVAVGTYQVNKVEDGGSGEEDSPRTERLGRLYLYNLSVGDQGEVIMEEMVMD